MMSSGLPGGSGGGLQTRASKRRRRRPPVQYQARGADTLAEERYLQQAIQNSKLDKNRSGDLDLPWGPVFYPTRAEFEGNPLDYIETIRPVAERYGIAKIVPPAGWNPAPFCVKRANKEDKSSNSSSTDNSKRFQTKLQVLHRLQEGISYGDGVEYTVDEYLQTSARRTQEWKAKYYPDHDLLSRHAVALEEKELQQQQQQQNDGATADSSAQQSNVRKKLFVPENLERDYWSIVETHTRQVTVEYGNDVDTSVFGSAFPLSQRGRSTAAPLKEGEATEENQQPEPEFGTPEYYRETYWNLNNMPNSPGSVLKYVKVGINGINVPWMYYGSLFTTFAYHNEDNYLYSVNYHHRGAPKQWYGVPGGRESADGLERVFKSYLSMKMRDVPDLLHHITTMFSPRLLQNANVPVCRLIQYEGEFVVTFPRAFHGGFSYGPNIGEAVNFASHDWIQYGADANERYRSFARPAVFSHDRLTFTMANHLEDQTSYAACKLLLNELERVVKEEVELRAKLLKHGVRDVSKCIELPKNRVDQLDEKSAGYDDKRLCHACKHVCFFSAVACECSQSKVSCLRHSHFMCRCAPEKKYFMIWSPNEELTSTLEKVRHHCETLKNREEDGKQQTSATEAVPSSSATPPATVSTGSIAATTAEAAPGSKKDWLWHKRDEIATSFLLDESYQPCHSIQVGRSQMEAEVDAALRSKQGEGQESNKCNPNIVPPPPVPVSSSSASSTVSSSSSAKDAEMSDQAGEERAGVVVAVQGSSVPAL